MKHYLLDAFGSVIGSEKAAYVAGPLATGRLYYELLGQGRNEEASNIRKSNELHMRIFIQQLRAKVRYPVIDPSVLVVHEWTPREMGDFFVEVLKKYVKEIWLIDDWQFSRGATKEFQFATVRGIRCINERGILISRDEGINLISEAASYISSKGVDASRFLDRLEGIRRNQYP